MGTVPAINQALTFSGDASTSGSTAYFPASLNGQYVEFTLYVQFSSGAGAGKVQIETAAPTATVPDGAAYTGTWAPVGSTIDWAAATSQKYASVTGIFSSLRARIDTTVTSGTVSAWLVAAG